MELSGEYSIPAPKNKVWEYLNDPEILKMSIKGCETLEKVSDNEFNAKVKAKIGPVSATFNGSVTLKNITAPDSYTIEGQGKGGAAGFAKGSVEISLSENEDNTTKLNYSGSAQVGGKLAQLGSRLVSGAVKNTADDFFKKFCELAEDSLETTTKEIKNNTLSDNNKTSHDNKLKIPYWGWVFSLIIVIFLIVAFFN